MILDSIWLDLDGFGRDGLGPARRTCESSGMTLRAGTDGQGMTPVEAPTKQCGSKYAAMTDAQRAIAPMTDDDCTNDDTDQTKTEMG